MKVERVEVEGGFRLLGRRGVVECLRLAPGLIRIHFDGSFSEETGPPIFEAFEQEIAGAGPLTLFFDAAKLKSYTPEFRRIFTSWLADHRTSVNHTGIYVETQLVRMGLTLANVVLGGFVRSYSTRDAFEAAIREATGSSPELRSP